MGHPKSKIQTLAVSCMLFFGIGLLSAIGPVLPDLARKTGSSLAEAGVLFSALFVGAVATQSISGQLADRFGTRRTLLVGIVLFGAGLLGATLSPSLPIAVISMLVAGLGDGILVVVANVLVVQSFNARRLVALNMANVFFGLGAIAGPALAAFSLQTWQSAIPTFWVLSTVVLLPVPLVLLMRLPSGASEDVELEPKRSVYRSPLLWLFGTVLLLYVGVEIGIGGWGATFLTRTTFLDAGTAALVLSAFWIAFTCGRLLAAFLSAICPPHILLRGTLIGILLGVLLLLVASGNSTLTIGALLLIAFCSGPVFPTVLGMTTSLFQQNAARARAASAVIVLGSMGGLFLPWLLGIVLVQISPLFYLLCLLFCVLLMLGIYTTTLFLHAETPSQ